MSVQWPLGEKDPLEVEASIRTMRIPGALPQEAALVQGLQLQAKPGTIHALLGPTGAGKTTFLRILAGLEHRFEGEVTIGGKRVEQPNHTVQLLFQDYRLMPWKTVRDNIAFGLREPDDGRVAEWLRIVRMQDRAEAWPRTLSGGETGRVALARAFVSGPRVLLLDEPFRNLDVVARLELQKELVAALERNPSTVLMVSHSVEDAVQLADVVHVLRARPMRVHASVAVGDPRPRKHGDASLAALAARVYGLLEEVSRVQGNPVEPTRTDAGGG